MARAITRSASASESAISSASTSWLLKVLRLASERSRVSMPCMVSASRLIMRASALTSSEPCGSQRLSMSPAASACATSPTAWIECCMELRDRPQHERRQHRGRQRAADHPAGDQIGAARFGEHAGLHALQHAAHAIHGFAQRGFERRAPRFEVGKCPGGRAAAHRRRAGSSPTLSKYCAAGCRRLSVMAATSGVAGQRPGRFELRAQRVDQVLRAAAGRGRGPAVGGDAGVQGERTIERALHGCHARQVRARLGLRLRGAQRAEHDARHAQHQDREHYVEARGDRNRRKPPARGSTCHDSPVFAANRVNSLSADSGRTLGVQPRSAGRRHATQCSDSRSPRERLRADPCFSAPPATAGRRCRRWPRYWW